MPWMTRVCAALATVFLAASPASAQDWQAQTSDTGSLLIGSAVHGSGRMAISCTAPSPQARPLIETGSHETHRSEPFQLHIAFDDSLFDWPADLTQRNVVLTVGQTGYRLPPFALDELSGTAVFLPMTDPLVAALTSAEGVTLDNGAGTAYRFGTEGLAAAMGEAMGLCVDRWAALGNETPTALRPWRSGPTYSARVEGSPGVYDIPPGMALHIVRLCNGGFSLDPGAYQSGNLDGDGLADYILNWRGVTCAGQTGLNPFCGAANCSIEVFLSSRNYSMVEELLGTSAGIVPLGNGRDGIRVNGTYSICGDGGVYCTEAFVWDGTRLTQ